MGDYMSIIEQKETFDISYQLYANVWNGQTKIEFKLKRCEVMILRAEHLVKKHIVTVR